MNSEFKLGHQEKTYKSATMHRKRELIKLKAERVEKSPP